MIKQLFKRWFGKADKSINVDGINLDRKLYISFGDYTMVVNHNDMFAACRTVMGKYLTHVQNEENPSMPKYFRVSDRGFAVHDDDLIMPLSDIIAQGIDDEMGATKIKCAIADHMMKKGTK